MTSSVIDHLMQITGELSGVYSEPIELKETFLDMAARFAHLPGTVILMSGGELDCARYHILAAKPWLFLKAKHRRITLSSGENKLTVEADPLDILRILADRFHMKSPVYPVPVAAGLFGYLAYDLKDCLETLPRTSIDTLGLPDICLFAPSIVVVHDKAEQMTRLFIPERRISGHNVREKDLIAFQKIMDSPMPAIQNFHGDRRGFQSNFTRTNYLKALQRIIDYIAAGDVYQVNMSQRFEMAFSGDSFHLFGSLYGMNPAPFFAYIQGGDHQIVSTSPERFICRTGNRVETRPIKGTRPRGSTPDEDQRFRDELRSSKKDDAELSMIVDLLRNDIGKVCEGGSVRVSEHKRLEAYQNVYHLVSIVEGTLQADKDSIDLIKATFPGGSITGCPKIRTMEIIDELEPSRRHIYTGAIGYLSFHDTMDLSIAIRTATIHDHTIYFSVGGGIVFDSDPADEFDETLHKGHTLMTVFEGKEKKAGQETVVWLNGMIESLEDATIPITDQGIQYGYGFFETLRADQGKIRFLAEHIERFNASWHYLFGSDPPDLTWDGIIHQVLTGNSLTDQTAAVKIIATRGSREVPPYDHGLMVTARPYTHRLAGKKEPGLHTAIYPYPRETPLADHKTLNYLYYLLAGNWATKQGHDEAIILNTDGTLSETNTANILLIKGQTVICPESGHVLPGVTGQVAMELLKEWGYEIDKRPVVPEEIGEMDQMLLTNSLMGAVPVLRIDGEPLKSPTDLWQRINERLFGK